MSIRGFTSRLLLTWARRASSRLAMVAGKWVAGNDPDANAAVYYVGTRYFSRQGIGLADAIDSALRARPSERMVIQPLLELADVRREDRVAAILAVIDSSLRYLEPQRGSDAASIIESALLYARDMLNGDFDAAFRRWSSMRSTCEGLASLDEVAAAQPRSTLSNEFSDDTTLAVVLPGEATEADLEVISHHSLVGRTASTSADTTDIVFLNRDRFVELLGAGATKSARFVVAKSNLKHLARGLPPAMKRVVRFELVTPVVPTAPTTYLTVAIALWTMASLRRPATFLCGDFYLGERRYGDSAYDDKKFLATTSDVRWSYLAHDVFFVHASLSRWFADGRIAAHGRLETILRMSTQEFVRCMGERWGTGHSS